MGNSRLRKAPTRRRLVLATLAVAVVCGIAIWRWPAPLTAEEEKLVGLWTFPVGPKPPTNAAQQFFENSARTGRCLPGAARSPTARQGNRTGGRWRLEGDSLIFEHATRDYWTKLARSLDGGWRPERTLVNRMHYLDADAFRVSGGNGGVVTFERVVRAGEGD